MEPTSGIEATLHFVREDVRVTFESEYAFINWLRYLKEHGQATAHLAAEGGRSVIVFRDHVTYIAVEGEVKLT